MIWNSFHKIGKKLDTILFQIKRTVSFVLELLFKQLIVAHIFEKGKYQKMWLLMIFVIFQVVMEVFHRYLSSPSLLQLTK